MVGTKRANSRENTTVVATINAAGQAMPPLIIFKGKRLQPAWFGYNNVGPPGAKYAVTDTSFMQGHVFVDFINDFHRHIKENGLDDGKPHILVLDGHASHVNFEVIKLAKSLGIELFQLPSHSSHKTQPLDVACFGIFKRQVTSTLSCFQRCHGGKTPGKPDMVGVINEAWAASFTVLQIKASFKGAGLWPVDMERALNRLEGCGKRKARSTDRPPLVDIPIAITDNGLVESLGPRSVRKLQRKGHTITGVKIGTVLFGEFLKARERVTRPAIVRGVQGITAGGNLTSDEVLERYRLDSERKEEEIRAKGKRADERAAKRVVKEAANAEKRRRREDGTSRGRGRGSGRGGGGRGGGRGRGGRGDPGGRGDVIVRALAAGLESAPAAAGIEDQNASRALLDSPPAVAAAGGVH